MEEKYIVYTWNTGNKLFESKDIFKAIKFAKELERKNRFAKFETERYEIVKSYKRNKENY